MTGRALARSWADARGGRRLTLGPVGRHATLSSALASPLAPGAWRRNRLLLEPLAERQLCTDPSSRFPLPRRPLRLAAAIEELAARSQSLESA